MKLFLIVFLISPTTFAGCHLYEIKGEVKSGKDFVELIVNKDTRSQMKLKVSPREVERLVPYFDLTVKGSFVMKSPVDRNSEILKVKSIKRDLPDLLNHKLNSFITKLKEVKCP